MLRALLVAQLRPVWRSWTLRLVAIGMIAVLAATFATKHATHPAELIERFAWTQLMVALVVGGCLVGWRVAQFPKSRAAEFYLVTPAADWQVVAGQVLGGMCCAALVSAASVPFVAGMWGAGWIRADETFALLAVPLVGGWLSGLVLATVAYEPAWVRRLGERLLLGVILAYLVLLGLFGSYFVPRLWSWRRRVSPDVNAAFDDIEYWMRYFNPFRLLEAVGDPAPAGFAWQVVSDLGVLIAVSLLCLWRLSARLRRHYLEENYGRQHGRKEYAQRIAENPLSWWTARRVSRFKGNVNLYLAWTTIGLYGAWLLLADRWPDGLAIAQLRVIQYFGGEALLGTAAIHLAVVPAMFLAGLWDSNTQQRLGRLELLLITPLGPRHFFTASIVAAWTRGRGYVLGGLAMWALAAAAGRFDPRMVWPLCLIAAVYMLLCFAAAFRNFARQQSDQAATLQGLMWSVGLPAVTIGLLAAGNQLAAAMTPLGAIYFLALPTAERAQRIAECGLSAWNFWLLLAAVFAVYLGIAISLLRSALTHFDREIREWFASHLVTRTATSKTSRPATRPA